MLVAWFFLHWLMGVRRTWIALYPISAPPMATRYLISLGVSIGGNPVFRIGESAMVCIGKAPMPPYRNDRNEACERTKFRRGGRLRIGCVFRSRNATFCRVLHIQVLEVIDFTRPGAGFVISRPRVQPSPPAPTNQEVVKFSRTLLAVSVADCCVLLCRCVWFMLVRRI